MHPAQFSDLPFSRLMAYFSSFMVYQIHRVLDQLRPKNSYSMIHLASGHLIIGVKGNNLLLIMTYIPTNHYIIWCPPAPQFTFKMNNRQQIKFSPLLYLFLSYQYCWCSSNILRFLTVFVDTWYFNKSCCWLTTKTHLKELKIL